LRRLITELGEHPEAEPPATQATQSLAPARRQPRPTPAQGALELPQGMAPAPMPGKAGYEVKGSLVRAYTKQIDQLGILPAVLHLVTPETRQQMEDLPLVSAWIDAAVIEEMIAAVESLRGTEAVRTVTRLGQETGVMPLIKPVVVGMLRLFGTSPHTLLSRFSQFTRNNVRGMAFEWRHDSERSGTLIILFPRQHVPKSAFIGFESGMEIICGLCSVKGNVAPTEISRDGATGTLHVSW
jgi:hypothetical protein